MALAVIPFSTFVVYNVLTQCIPYVCVCVCVPVCVVNASSAAGSRAVWPCPDGDRHACRRAGFHRFAYLERVPCSTPTVCGVYPRSHLCNPRVSNPNSMRGYRWGTFNSCGPRSSVVVYLIFLLDSS